MIDGRLLTRAAIAPLLAEPVVVSTQISQFLHGHSADIVERAHDWLRVRGSDGYEGWAHRAYFDEVAASDPLASGWETDGLLSLGCSVTDSSGIVRRLPLGAILAPAEELVEGIVLTPAERRARFPRDAASIVAAAVELFEGTWYQWGGLTPWGCDCSGLVQTSFALHGVGLRRDAALQATQGLEVEGGLENVREADLLFFSERQDGFITHVAISRGGSRIVHLTLYQGGHALDDLAHDSERLRTLRSRFRFARRIL